DTMPTNVVMPQMGESIAEGTIVRWIKKVGDKVDRDEPLFEISTDKVDAEIPSPGAGGLTESKGEEGGTGPGKSGGAVIGGAAATPQEAPAETPIDAFKQALSEMPEAATGQPDQEAESRDPEAESREPEAEGRELEAGSRQRTSPLVRRIAAEHNIDI